jgi:glycine cleavage system regulatory protein
MHLIQEVSTSKGLLMNTQFTVTIAFKNHPQLVSQLAATTHELGGKWIVSKINRLDQQWVGIIKVEIPEEAADQLKQEFKALNELDICIIENDTSTTPCPREQVTLKIESSDRLGIVNDITHVLDDIGIDIVQIENHRVAVPELGQIMFYAELALAVPSDVDLRQLVESVQQVEKNMHVELLN